MNIRKAALEDLDQIAELFDSYRQYYECEPDAALAQRFIQERLEKGDSDIFVASIGETVAGFVQLYPSLCSIAADKIYILHDLYVHSDYRRDGAGRKLMNTATQWAKDNGAVRLDLLTEKSNNKAQGLYESLGYAKELEDFYAYSLNLPK